MRARHERAGFTLVDLAAVTLTVGVLLGAGPALLRAAGQPEPSKQADGKAADPKDESARLRERMMTSATNLRQIGQGMILWGNSHGDQYPLPSVVDASNFTVQDAKPAKDTTANIMSILVYAGYFKPETLVSPAETNANIEACKSYALKQPPTAVSPAKALWDPALCADFTGDKKGNVSYAHLCPYGARLGRWTVTFASEEPVLADRGPEVKAVKYAEDNSAVTVELANPSSNTLKFSKEPGTWSGHLYFNDAHVEFKDTTLGHTKSITTKDLGRKVKFAEDRTHPDLWMYDEPDDQAAANDYIGIFTASGRQRGDFKAIWD
jgi:hypothetical protein